MKRNAVPSIKLAIEGLIAIVVPDSKIQGNRYYWI